MTIRVVYPQARQEQASLPGKVASHRQVVIINRRNAEPAAIIAADELVGLTERAYLPGSPANASRLRDAPARALKGGGTSVTLSWLWANVGLERQAAGSSLSARLPPPRGG